MGYAAYAANWAGQAFTNISVIGGPAIPPPMR
jgi:hypothetical protein